MQMDWSVLTYAGLTIVLWGGWGFFGKLALHKGMPPLALFVAEVAVGLGCAAAVLIYVQATGTRTVFADWNRYGVLSGAGLALGLILAYLALQQGLAVVVVPLTALYPAVAVLLSVLVLDERPSAAQWIGLALVLAGGILLAQGRVQQ